MPSDSSSGSLYMRLAASETYLTGVLSDLRAGRRPSRSLPTTDRVRVAVPSLSDYAAAEKAWQESGGFASSASRGGDLPERWRLPEPSRAKVAVPSIRLDADTAPQVHVSISHSAYEAITAEAMRCDGVETGGWLVGQVAHGWHRDRSVTDATVAARARKPGSVALDAGAFARMDARLHKMRDRDGALRGIGDWHTHPHSGDGWPSEADLRCQALDLATISDHNFSLTSLIVTRNKRFESWARPTVTAWITRHARSSFGERMVCEPATVNVP